MVFINSINFGSIIIDKRTYPNDVMISWDGEIKEMVTSARHLFGKKELDELLKKMPEMVIIGTGDSGLLRVSNDIKEICSQKRVGLIEAISKHVITKFNESVNQGKKVVAFIHVTC